MVFRHEISYGFRIRSSAVADETARCFVRVIVHFAKSFKITQGHSKWQSINQSINQSERIRVTKVTNVTARLSTPLSKACWLLSKTFAFNCCPLLLLTSYCDVYKSISSCTFVAAFNKLYCIVCVSPLVTASYRSWNIERQIIAWRWNLV